MEWNAALLWFLLHLVTKKLSIPALANDQNRLSLSEGSSESHSAGRNPYTSSQKWLREDILGEKEGSCCKNLLLMQ